MKKANSQNIILDCFDSDGNTCPSYVNPTWLTAAEGQYSCNLRGHYCTAACIGSEVFWFAHDCPKDGECPPHGRGLFQGIRAGAAAGDPSGWRRDAKHQGHVVSQW